MSRDHIQFLLDGELIRERVFDPTLSVLQYLRERRLRTGTKEGCAEGDCGACTIVIGEACGEHVHYKAVNACIIFLATLDGKEIRTVESLGTPHSPHPIQKLLADKNGSQCGFCTPGFVMSLYALQISNIPANPGNVSHALAGNLCRCTGYGPIIEAALEMGENAPETSSAQDLKSLQHDECVKISATIEGENKVFYIPKTLEQLEEIYAKNPGAVLLAGGTDVGLWVTKRHQCLNNIIYLGAISALNILLENAKHVEIGAGVNYSDALPILTKYYPDMGAVMRRIGGQQIRNLGTIGGNIANGSPIGDMAPLLIAAGATLALRRAGTLRTLALEGFFIDYGKQDLRAGEFVKAVNIPKPRPDQRFFAYKISKRFEQDISALCAAFSFELKGGTCTQVRIAYGGMAATPKRAVLAEKTLEGQRWSEENIRRAMAALEDDFTPISDMRASKDYRMRTAQNLLLKAFYENKSGQPIRVLEENLGH